MIAALFSPAGRVLLVVAMLIAAMTTGYIRGGADAAARCQVETLNRQLEALRRDLTIAEAATADAAASMAAARARETDLQDKVAAYETELAGLPKSGRCSITGDDVRRLRDIGSGGGAGSPAGNAGRNGGKGGSSGNGGGR